MKKHLFRLLCTVLPLALLTGCWQGELIEEEPDALPPVVEEEPPPETPRVVLPETFALPYAPSQQRWNAPGSPNATAAVWQAWPPFQAGAIP